LHALIRLFLEEAAFTSGLERLEAAALWNAAEAESNRLNATFDEPGFAALLAARSTVAPAPPPPPAFTGRQHWGDIPDVTRFLGRATEQNTLKRWLHDSRTRVVAVIGMGGMGKTLLGARTAVDLAPEFDRVCWRSLREAPPFDDWLTETIRVLSPDQQLPQPLSGVDKLLELAHQSSCLLVLDNYESVLEPHTSSGGYRPGYEWYGGMLQAFAQSPHQSRLLLTSRERPPELAALHGDAAQLLLLTGLPANDGRTLLRDHGLTGEPEAWETLTQRYAGNPLALKLAGASIRELFGGDIGAYLADLELGQSAIFGDVRRLLDTQLQRLADVEQQVLRWFAVEREPMSFAELAANLGSGYSRRDARETVEALLRRSLLERREAGPNSTFSLHPVVLEYVTEQLAEEVADEISAGELQALRVRPLTKAVAKEYVRANQERVLVWPVLERSIARLGSRSAVTQHLMRLLVVLRVLPWDEQGYAPGNITNLLRLLRGDLIGLDLSGLSVRQAYLQDVEMLDANLARARLVESVLTEAFEFTGAVSLSANGEYLAAGTTHGDVCLWRVEDRVLQALGTGHTSASWGVALSADGRQLASGGLDGTVRLWDPVSGMCLATGRGHRGGVRSVALSGDGQILVSGGDDGTLRLWDGLTSAPLAVADAHPGGVWSVAASNDGRLVASCGIDGMVRLWDGRDGRSLALLPGHAGRLYGVTLTRNGGLVISAGIDGTVRAWETAAGKMLGTLQGHRGVIQGVACNEDGQVVATVGADGAVRLWNVVSGAPLAALHHHVGGIRGVAVTVSGHMLASVGDDGTIRLWESATGQVLATLQGHTGWQRDVALSRDGRLIVGAGNDGRVRLWDVDGDAPMLTMGGHTGGVWAVALSDDSRLLATAGDDGTVRLWDLPGGTCRAVLRGHQGGVWRVTMGGDGRLVASGGLDGTLRLWSGDGRLVGVLEGHRDGVRAAAFSANGRVLVSGGLEGLVKLWPSAGRGQPRVLEGHTGLIRAVAANADASRVVSGGADSTLRMWDPDRGREVVRIEGVAGIRAVALNRDGIILATGGDDGLVRLWSASTGESLSTVTAHVGGVWGVAIGADGHTFASGGADGMLRLWDLRGPTLQREYRADRPYERMDITGLTGVTAAQRGALIALGAVDRMPRGIDDEPVHLAARVASGRTHSA
jgi:WD40 repeat protein